MKINKIILDQEFKSKDEVFQFLDQQMQELSIVDAQNTYYNALLEREEQSSTGLVDGFAIPHGKSSKIKDAAIVYIRNNTGIEWNSLDGSLITDIFALAIPDNGQSNHLDTLIAISTQLMDAQICKKLRDTSDINEIEKIFNK